MHLLYLDDSGSVSDKSDRYVVLAGFCVNEKQTHWIDKGMNELVRPFAGDEGEGAQSIQKWILHQLICLAYHLSSASRVCPLPHFRRRSFGAMA